MTLIRNSPEFQTDFIKSVFSRKRYYICLLASDRKLDNLPRGAKTRTHSFKDTWRKQNTFAQFKVSRWATFETKFTKFSLLAQNVTMAGYNRTHVAGNWVGLCITLLSFIAKEPVKSRLHIFIESAAIFRFLCSFSRRRDELPVS